MEGSANQKKRIANTDSIATALRTIQRQEAAPPKPIRASVPWEKALGKDKYAAIVPNVLSEEECDSIIRTCEARGFEPALLNVGLGVQRGSDLVPGETNLAADMRTCGRCIVDDADAAEILWERLKHAVPDEICPREDGTWRPVGLNERFRVLKYEPGDYFVPHCNGSSVRLQGAEPPPIGEPKSFFTLVLYLNTLKKSGETNVATIALSLGSSLQCQPYLPSTGQALVFDHGIRHEGALHEAGVMYAIRTDVMYRQTPEKSCLDWMREQLNSPCVCLNRLAGWVCGCPSQVKVGISPQ